MRSSCIGCESLLARENPARVRCCCTCFHRRSVGILTLHSVTSFPTTDLTRDVADTPFSESRCGGGIRFGFYLHPHAACCPALARRRSAVVEFRFLHPPPFR